MSNIAEDAIYIIKRMELSDHQCQYNRGHSQRKDGIIELEANNIILAQNKLITQTVE